MRTLASALRRFHRWVEPRLHPHGIVAVIAATLFIIGWLVSESVGTQAVAKQIETRPLTLPPAPENVAPVVPEPDPAIHHIAVRPGQTLAEIFSELGLTARDVHKVVHLDEHTRKLARIYPGDELVFRLDEDGGFLELQHQLDEATRLRVRQTDQGLRSELIAADLVRRIRQASGMIEDSLFLAGRKAGMTDGLIMELAHLFGWDIDFVLDIRRGDSFQVLYEEIFRDGEFIRTGDILAATFVNRGKKFQAVRFETEDGVGYYSPDGRNMKKAFLRAPLNFSYISSRFNPRRFHPILKRVKAHNGIDYRAPSGTPVYAAGDGRVITSAYSKYNGHHVFIRHPNGIITKYLHFTRRTVNKGDRVTQGQVIGYVGSTGLATASHLHYEFIVNGVHRNPATVDLPKADPLPDAQLAVFQRSSKPLLAQLDRMQADMMLASAD